MRIIFYIRKLNHCHTHQFFDVIHVFTYYRAFQSYTELQKKKKRPHVPLFVKNMHESNDWWKLPKRQQKCQNLTVFFRQLAIWPFLIKKLSQQSISHNLTMSQHISQEMIPENTENLTGYHHQWPGSVTNNTQLCMPCNSVKLIHFIKSSWFWYFNL